MSGPGGVYTVSGLCYTHFMAEIIAIPDVFPERGADEKPRRAHPERPPRRQKRAASEDAAAFVARRYALRDGDPVRDFLARRPPVAQALVDASPIVEEFFGKGVVVSLRLSCDGESDPILSANVQTALDVSEARAARKAFHASWWKHQSEQEELPLTFNLEYV